MCKKCTPSQSPLVFCNKPEEITEVNCDNEALPSNFSGVKFDSCTVAKIVTIAGPAYPMECAVKVSCNLILRAFCAFKMAGGETTGYSPRSNVRSVFRFI